MSRACALAVAAASGRRTPSARWRRRVRGWRPSSSPRPASRPRSDRLPLFERLEFERLRGDIGHVELREQLPRRSWSRCRRGRRPARSRSARRARRSPARRRMKNCSTAGRASSPLAKAGIDLQPARLQRRDHAVVMGGVVGQDVGAHQQQADRRRRVRRRARQCVRVSQMRPGSARMIDADFGIFDRRRRLAALPRRRASAPPA